MIGGRRYETAALMAVIFGAISLSRMYLFRTTRESVLMGGALVLLVLVGYIAVQFIVTPRSPQNMSAFLDSIWVNNRNWEAIATNTF